jgi:hypothetical protein
VYQAAQRSGGGSYLAGSVVEYFNLVCLSESLQCIGVFDDAFGSYRIDGHPVDSAVSPIQVSNAE